MRTILIYAEDKDFSSAGASYLSENGCAVFTAKYSMEAAEVISMIKLDAVVISSNKSTAFLVLGKLLRANERILNIIGVTKIESSVLKLLLETEDFTKLDSSLSFSSLERMVNGTQIKSEEMQNVFV